MGTARRIGILPAVMKLHKPLQTLFDPSALVTIELTADVSPAAAADDAAGLCSMTELANGSLLSSVDNVETGVGDGDELDGGSYVLVGGGL